MNRIQVILLILIISSEQNIWANSGFKFKSRNCSNLGLICLVGNCESAKKEINSGICYAHINLAANASDNCSLEENLVWEYQIDLNNDGIGIYNGFDLKVSKLSKKNYLLGALPSINDNIYANKIGYPFDASGTYPLGTHRICWTVENVCGDKTECCKIFIINDCEVPTPICITGFKTFDLPFKGLEIFAKELDNGSYDNCTLKENLLFYFDGEPSKTSIKVTCEDFIKAGVSEELRLDIELWIEDEAGNIARCKTIFIVRDVIDICPIIEGWPKLIIQGEIKTQKNKLIGNTIVTIKNNENILSESRGNPFEFVFFLPGNNGLFEVVPSKIDNHLNGVSIIDVAIINRHLLNHTILISPYQLIAADVNNNKSISRADISELKKLIIGLIDEFKNVKSWSFIPERHIFLNPLSPFDYASFVKIYRTGLDAGIDTIDFIGAKMGDVNCDAIPNFSNNTNFLSKPIKELNIENQILTEGELYELEFKTSDISSIIAFQARLNYDTTKLMFDSYKSGRVSLDDQSLIRFSDGDLIFLWYDSIAVKLMPNDILFSIQFKVLKNTNVFNLFNVGVNKPFPFIYDKNMDESILSLRVVDNEPNVGIVINDIIPNPWNIYTKINFILIKSEDEVELIVYDNLGKNIYSDQMKGEKGLNVFELGRTKVQDSGIYYFEIITKRESKSGKIMIY